MAKLIMVDRPDGRAAAGLLTAVLAQWDRIPLDVQAAIIHEADSAAFAEQGMAGGHYAVAAFVLKQRAAMLKAEERRANKAGRSRAAAGRFLPRPRDLVDAAARWAASGWRTGVAPRRPLFGKSA